MEWHPFRSHPSEDLPTAYRDPLRILPGPPVEAAAGITKRDIPVVFGDSADGLSLAQSRLRGMGLGSLTSTDLDGLGGVGASLNPVGGPGSGPPPGLVRLGDLHSLGAPLQGVTDIPFDSPDPGFHASQTTSLTFASPVLGGAGLSGAAPPARSLFAGTHATHAGGLSSLASSATTSVSANVSVPLTSALARSGPSATPAAAAAAAPALTAAATTSTLRVTSAPFVPRAMAASFVPRSQAVPSLPLAMAPALGTGLPTEVGEEMGELEGEDDGVYAEEYGAVAGGDDGEGEGDGVEDDDAAWAIRAHLGAQMTEEDEERMEAYILEQEADEDAEMLGDRRFAPLRTQSAGARGTALPAGWARIGRSTAAVLPGSGSHADDEKGGVSGRHGGPSAGLPMSRAKGFATPAEFKANGIVPRVDDYSVANRVCTFFQHGVCRHGATCRNIHVFTDGKCPYCERRLPTCSLTHNVVTSANALPASSAAPATPGVPGGVPSAPGTGGGAGAVGSTSQAVVEEEDAAAQAQSQPLVDISTAVEAHTSHLKNCVEFAHVQQERALSHGPQAQCSVCLNEPLSVGRRFGLLSHCSHIFCLECIREWRGADDKFVSVHNSAQLQHQHQQARSLVRTCPVCRVQSFFVIPSDRIVTDPDRKMVLVTRYKDQLNAIPCKYWRDGMGECPFGSSCFYAHMDKVRLTRPQKTWLTRMRFCSAHCWR